MLIVIISCTIIPQQSIGELNRTTNQYTGAIGLVQRQEADMLLQVVYYPLVDPDQEHFEYAMVNIVDRMMIGSVYNYSDTFESKDVLDLWTGFEVEFFWAAFASFSTLAVTRLVATLSIVGSRLVRSE